MSSSNLEGILMVLGMVLCPLAAGVGAVAGAVAIHRQQAGQVQRSAGNTIAVVLLSIVGAGLLVVALAMGACWGIIGLNGLGTL